jgi:hypothetical protein
MKNRNLIRAIREILREANDVTVADNATAPLVKKAYKPLPKNILPDIPLPKRIKPQKQEDISDYPGKFYAYIVLDDGYLPYAYIIDHPDDPKVKKLQKFSWNDFEKNATQFDSPEQIIEEAGWLVKLFHTSPGDVSFLYAVPVSNPLKKFAVFSSNGPIEKWLPSEDD